jgi:hypothetical protein
MSAEMVDEKLAGIARAGEERREQAGAEFLELSETLANIEKDRSRAALSLHDAGESYRGVEGRQRLVFLTAVSGDEGAARELDELDTEANALRRRVGRRAGLLNRPRGPHLRRLEVQDPRQGRGDYS